MADAEPLVSVIVTTYTMERLHDLASLLDSLVQQAYPRFEVVLVLEKSRELYASIQKYIKSKDYRGICLLFNAGPGGASAGRNLGIRQARGSILAFIDDDAVASPDWLNGIVNTFQKDGTTIGVTGPILPLWENEKLTWLPEEFYWIVSCMPARQEGAHEVRNAWGNNMAFRREAFEKSGLFLTQLGAKGGGARGKHELSCEDTEFSIRACAKTRKRIVYNPHTTVYHRVYGYRFTWRFVTSRAYWEGYTKVLLKKSLGNETLAIECRLLWSILSKLLPSTLAGLTIKPADSWRRLKFITIVLSSIAIGYGRGMFERSDTLGGEACVEYL